MECANEGVKHKICFACVIELSVRHALRCVGEDSEDGLYYICPYCRVVSPVGKEDEPLHVCDEGDIEVVRGIFEKYGMGFFNRK